MIHRSFIFEAVQEQKRSLLKRIFEALKATEIKHEDVITTKDKDDEKDKKVSNMVVVLEKLEQVHREHNMNLSEENHEIQSPGVKKITKMEQKIRNVKESLGTEDKTIAHLLDQPNADGDTLLHLTTRLKDIETTRLLLAHGSNPNVQDVEGNSPLHIACSKGDIQTVTCIIKNNGKLLANKQVHTPALENLYLDHQKEDMRVLMTAIDQSKHRREILESKLDKIVDGLVERVKANQLDKKIALDVLFPDDKGGGVLFQLAKGSHWGLIDNWAKEEGVDFSTIVQRMNLSGLEDMVEVAKEYHKEKDRVHALLCEEDDEKNIVLSRLSFKTQQEVVFWNQDRTNQIAHKISKDLLQCLIQAANKGNWNGEGLGGAFLQLNSDNKLKLTTVDAELQKQLIVLNKIKACSSVPLIENNIQFWMYQEALEGRWDPEMIFRVLREEEAEGSRVTPVYNQGITLKGSLLKHCPKLWVAIFWTHIF